MSLWYLLGFCSIIVGTVTFMLFVLVIAYVTVNQTNHKLAKELEDIKFNNQMDQIESLKRYELATRKQFNPQEQ